MIPKKQNGIRLCLVGILCVLLLLLSIGTAQGRIRINKGVEASFQPYQTRQVCLWAEGDPADLQPLTGWTETGVGSAALHFQVSNGSPEDYCGDTMQFRVRIAASLGIGKPENVALTLQIDGKTYTAKATPIPEGSARYQTFGPGWVYSFIDDSGNELAWELPGGKLSLVDALLTATGAGEYTSLLRTEVTACW